MTKINVVNWIKTNLYIKLIRASIRATLAYLIINKFFY